MMKICPTVFNIKIHIQILKILYNFQSQIYVNLCQNPILINPF